MQHTFHRVCNKFVIFFFLTFCAVLAAIILIAKVYFFFLGYNYPVMPNQRAQHLRAICCGMFIIWIREILLMFFYIAAFVVSGLLFETCICHDSDHPLYDQIYYAYGLFFTSATKPEENIEANGTRTISRTV